MTHTHRRRVPLVLALGAVAASGLLAGCRTTGSHGAPPLAPDSVAVLRDIA